MLMFYRYILFNFIKSLLFINIYIHSSSNLINNKCINHKNKCINHKESYGYINLNINCECLLNKNVDENIYSYINNEVIKYLNLENILYNNYKFQDRIFNKKDNENNILTEIGFKQDNSGFILKNYFKKPDQSEIKKFNEFNKFQTLLKNSIDESTNLKKDDLLSNNNPFQGLGNRFLNKINFQKIIESIFKR